MQTYSKLRQWAQPKWRWLIPILLVLMFLATLIWLPLQAQRIENGERQRQLIADTLWAEQAINFQLDRNEEALRLLANDIAQDGLTPATVTERLRQLLKSNYEIHRVDWLDEQAQVVSSTSGEKVALVTKAQLQALRLGSGSFVMNNKTRCLPPAPEPGSPDTYMLSCEIPLMPPNPQNQPNRHMGSLVVSYGMQRLLDEMVPWWFAQDNQISILDEDEKVLADRAAGGAGSGVYVVNRALELPGLSLVLRANSKKTSPGLLANLLVISVVLLSLGLVWSLIALWRDINRRLATEGALQQQVAFRSAMENSLNTGLRARDMEGRLTYVNPAFCAMVGYPAEQIVGSLPPMPYWAPEAFEEYQTRFKQMLSGNVSDKGFELVYQRANGERFTALIHESPLMNKAGQQTGWMSSVLDISELKQAQQIAQQQAEKLYSSARLVTVGEIGSVLAHELNQPLAAISSYATGGINMIASGKFDPLQLQGALQKVADQAQRAGMIIRSVHGFVKKREVSRAPMSIAALVNNILPLVELQAHALFVNVQCQIAPDLPLVMADKALLEQVLLNLTRNAVESMTECPPLSRNLRISARQAAASADLAAAVVVEVSDHGHGISETVARELFLPFFSTKASGMGMGLNICRSAIEFHGGRLEHQDNPGGGTIFRFLLPSIADHADGAGGMGQDA